MMNSSRIANQCSNSGPRGGWSREDAERSEKKITFWLVVPLCALLVILIILLGLRHHHLGLLDWLLLLACALFIARTSWDYKKSKERDRR